MNAHAATDPEALAVLPDKDFNAFLDSLMFKLYDTVKAQKPSFIVPTLTLYRRGDYKEPYQAVSHAVPPTQDIDQIATMEVLGASAAAEFNDGRIPVAAFLVTMGQKQTPAIGTELDENQIRESTQEVVLISGATIDGRISQAIYVVSRDRKQNIGKVDLKIYVPSRPQQSEKSVITSPLLAAFYSGYANKYIEVRKEQQSADGGPRHGDIILPS